MFNIVTSSVILLLLITLSINLTACSPEQYQLHTQLKRNGVLLGPLKVTLLPGSTKDFLLPLSEANELRYRLLKNKDGTLELQAELVNLTSDTEAIVPLPGFILLPNGETAELEFQLGDKQPHYQWTASVTPF